MKGPAAVLALVLAETAAGGAGFLFLTPLWTEVRHGFFYLTGGVVLVLALSAAGSAGTGFDPALVPEGRVGTFIALALAGATLLWIVLMAVRRPRPARILGIATVPLAVAMLVAFAAATPEGYWLSFFQLLAGAVFTGAVLDGLLLGHWYLTDRKLTRGPINRMAWLLIGSVALEAVAVVAGGLGAPEQAKHIAARATAATRRPASAIPGANCRSPSRYRRSALAAAS